MELKILDRYKKTKNIAVLGIVANLFLSVIKLIVGITSNSQSMLADGFNSVGDVFSSLMTYIGNKISSKPKDSFHPYGHGKSEYIFSMLIGLSLIIIAINIMGRSINAYLNNTHLIYSKWLIIVGIVTIVIKAILFVYTKYVGKKYNNILVIANSEDHRNDVILTSGTLISILLSELNIFWFDSLVGIIIAAWIMYTGAKLFKIAYYVLMDTGIDFSLNQKITDIVLEIDGIDHIDDITAKPTGYKFLVVIKVSVDGNMTVNESHKIAGIVRSSINGIENVQDTIVHINPC
ncbi:MAG: cation diffusion facilitator family transporter [Clostridia bacterium]|nr:cation diffusion facilitator family transporter [Clostridia bacterium]